LSARHLALFRGLSAPSLDINFLSGQLDSRIAFTRAAGAATYFDSAGNLQSAGTDVPRFDYDPATLEPRGLLMEEARTNGIRNSVLAGSAPGTPGTLPTNWAVQNLTAPLAVNVVGSGTESGIAYVDLRWSGTMAGAGTIRYAMEAAAIIAATNAQLWSVALNWRLVAGSFANVSSPAIEIGMYDSTPTLLTSLSSIKSLPTNAALATQRQTAAQTLNQATVAWVRPQFSLAVVAGAVDFTLRVGAPQLELGGYPTSVIPTAGAAATRAADNNVMPLGSWYNPSEGTIEAEGFVPFINALVGQTAIELCGGSTANRIRMYNNGGAGAFAIGSTVATANLLTANLPGGGALAGQVNKCAAAVGPRGIIAASNRSFPLQDSQATSLAAWSQIRFGCSVALSAYLGGYFRRVRYWPRALSLAQVQGVTQ
jgi:hypothetical protein